MELFFLVDIVYKSTYQGSALVPDDSHLWYGIDAQVAYECFQKFCNRCTSLENIPIQILDKCESNEQQDLVLYEIVRTIKLHRFSNLISTLIKNDRTLIFNARTLNATIKTLSEFKLPNLSYEIKEARDVSSDD